MKRDGDGDERRTLLIDADLRKPATPSLVRGRKSLGLSDIPVGKARASQTIQQNLQGTMLPYLSSGTHVPSPADLLATRTMRGLLDGLRRFYDWIVVDTSPVGAVAEPLILAPLTDGAVVVAGAEMVPRKAGLHTLERIRDTGAGILGLVLKRAQVDEHSYYYSHYYGHHYGQYYGTRPSSRKSADAKVTSTDEERAGA